MSDSMPPHRRQPTRLPCPQNSLGKNTGVGCHFLSRDLFLDFFFTKNLWDDSCESHSVVSDSLRPHGLQQARLPCPSPTPRAWGWRQIWTKLRIWQVKVHGRLAGLERGPGRDTACCQPFVFIDWRWILYLHIVELLTALSMSYSGSLYQLHIIISKSF